MSTFPRIALALTLGIAACCAALTPAAPARACGGSYEDSATTQVRAATVAFMHERMPSAQSKRVHAVKVEGNTAKVQIRFRSPKATEDSAQSLGLTRSDSGVWRVTMLGYTVPARLVAAR